MRWILEREIVIAVYFVPPRALIIIWERSVEDVGSVGELPAMLGVLEMAILWLPQ